MTSNSTFNFIVDLQKFEENLQKFGEKLDDFKKTISLNPTETSNNANTKDEIIVKNEILSIFNKSKIHPNQFAELLVTSNIYIENEKMGDWTNLKINEVEENIYNMKHEIDKPKNKNQNQKDQIEYTNIITQNLVNTKT
jgi:hypothetical protein